MLHLPATDGENNMHALLKFLNRPATVGDALVWLVLGPAIAAPLLTFLILRLKGA
jgi:hypothetical protein